jgi:DNA-directed RNA polymerase specialized sigma24 family protein
VVIDGQRRKDALDQLPLPYSTALRLRDAGIAPALIAECVGVEEESLPSLLRLAEKKLAATGYLGTA